MTLDSEMTFGGGAGDVAQAIALWGTKQVIVGYTHSFGAGGLDAFIAIDDGTTLKMWTFGTSRDEQAFAVAIHDNYAYIVGAIDYAVAPNINYFDIFVAKWNLMLETLVGFTIIGWNEHPFADAAFAVAADSTYVFVTGRWADDKSFLAILDAGTLNVVKMLRLDLGTGNEFAYAIDFTTGITGYYIIVGGVTNTAGFGDYDAFLARIDVSWDASAVSLQWALRFGTAGPDGVTSIKFVSYETFAVGGTLGGNGFIGYFTIDGGFLKARATVFSSTSIITSLAWDGNHLAAAGYFNNPPNLDDAYILLIDENGLLVDAKAYGGGHIDRAHGVALDSSNVHVAGITYTFPNNVFAISFDYEEVQVLLTTFTPTITPYMFIEDITGSLSLIELTLGTKTNKKIVIIATSIILSIFLVATIIEQGVAMTLDSEMTFGGGAGDVAQAIALWGTKQVIVGYTHSFGAGGLDAFIAVNDGTTLKMWTFGTLRDEQAFAVAIHANYAYIVGAIDYAVAPNINYFDIFVAKWDLMLETLVGFTIIGRNEHPFADAAFAVAADANYVFVTGRWADDKSFLAILHAGTLNVVKMYELYLGTGNEFAYAIDFTTGITGYYIIVGGATNTASFGDYDAFLARIDWDGSTAKLQWALRFGTDDPDGVTSIKFVSYETFAVGGTLGGNGFIGYFTIEGGFLKARATVFSSTSIITSLAWNNTHLAAAGYFNNPPNLDDAYILLIDKNGLLVDATGYGGGHIDRAHGVALDSRNVHVAGITLTFSNNVFPLPFTFTYEEVQVILTTFTPTITPYMKTEDITGPLILNELTLGTQFNVNTIFITVLPISTLTFNSPVNGDVFK
jgi:heat shock protein HslJ